MWLRSADRWLAGWGVLPQALAPLAVSGLSACVCWSFSRSFVNRPYPPRFGRTASTADDEAGPSAAAGGASEAGGSASAAPVLAEPSTRISLDEPGPSVAAAINTPYALLAEEEVGAAAMQAATAAAPAAAKLSKKQQKKQRQEQQAAEAAAQAAAASRAGPSRQASQPAAAAAGSSTGSSTSSAAASRAASPLVPEVGRAAAAAAVAPLPQVVQREHAAPTRLVVQREQRQRTSITNTMPARQVMEIMQASTAARDLSQLQTAVQQVVSWLSQARNNPQQCTAEEEAQVRVRRPGCRVCCRRCRRMQWHCYWAPSAALLLLITC